MSPPRNLSIFNHSANSVWLHWEPSLEPNGIIQHYGFRILELNTYTFRYQVVSASMYSTCVIMILDVCKLNSHASVYPRTHQMRLRKQNWVASDPIIHMKSVCAHSLEQEMGISTPCLWYLPPMNQVIHTHTSVCVTWSFRNHSNLLLKKIFR